MYQALVSTEPAEGLERLTTTDPEAVVAFLYDTGDSLLPEELYDLDDDEFFDFEPWWHAFLKAFPHGATLSFNPRWLDETASPLETSESDRERLSLATIAARYISMPEDWLFNLCLASPYEADQASAIEAVRSRIYALYGQPADVVVAKVSKWLVPTASLASWHEMTRVALRRGQIGQVDVGVWCLGALGPEGIKLPGDVERRVLHLIGEQQRQKPGVMEGLCAWAFQRHPVAMRDRYPGILKALLLSPAKEIRLLAAQAIGS